jgi:hypothetical protein
MSMGLDLNDNCRAMLSGEQSPALQHAERASITPAGRITT